MKINRFNKFELIAYTAKQLQHFFPDGESLENMQKEIRLDIEQALERTRVCINAVKFWKIDELDYLHSTQYTLFIYYLSSTIWRNRKNQNLCNKLFYLNKALNGIDMFYEIEMPDIFFIGHSVGIVLAKANYSNYLVLYQNSTVGKNHGVAPSLGEGVIMYPNTAIIGRCEIGSRTVLSQGVSLINQNTPEDSFIFGGGKSPIIKKLNKNILGDIFREAS